MTDNIDETIVIVGGAGGIGSATVRKYASLEKCIIIGDINQKAALNLVKKLGRNVRYIPLDILDYTSIKEFSQTLKDDYGTVSHLINLAGGALPEEPLDKSIEDVSVECISKTIDLNLKSHLYLIKEFLPLIKKDKSPNRTITLVSSISALFSFGQPAYSSAKAGLIGLVHATANELGEFNIRINAVLPGSVPTQLSERFLKEFFEQLRNASSLKRLSTVDEIANTIYAVTHLMTSVTGQSIVSDSGQLISYPFRKN